MNVWAMVPILIFSIPIIGIIAGVSTQRLKMKLEAGRAATSDDLAQMKAELAQSRVETTRLQDRVAVLERLITDEDRRVANEISRLGGDGRSGRQA